MSRPRELPACLQHVRRILIIRRKGLGDALVSLPSVLSIAAAMPAATIDLVVDRPFADLLTTLARDLRVLAWPPPSGGPGWLTRLRAARYDLVVDYLGSPRTALWTALSGAPLRVGYDLPRRRWAYNVRVGRNRAANVDVAAFAGEAFLDPLRALGLTPPPWRPVAGRALAVPDAALGAAYRRWIASFRKRPAPRVALVLSAGWPAKAWPAGHAARLLTDLASRAVTAVLVPGPGDEALVAQVRQEAPGAAVAPPTSLLELADLLRHCDVCVGTDSGARHLAACLHVPTVTLFGPTDPRGWNPADPRHVAVHNPVPCAPCDLRVCPVPGHPCLDALMPATVAATISQLVTRLAIEEKD